MEEALGCNLNGLNLIQMPSLLTEKAADRLPPERLLNLCMKVFENRASSYLSWVASEWTNDLDSHLCPSKP